MASTDFGLQLIAYRTDGGEWRAPGAGIYRAEPEDGPSVAWIEADGHEAAYHLYPHQTPEDLARWYASVHGGSITYYPVRLGDRRYSVTDTLGDMPEAIRQDDDEHAAEAWCRQREADLLAALREIAKGQGRFSLDHHEHACNTIEDMKAIAVEAIAKAEGRA